MEFYIPYVFFCFEISDCTKIESRYKYAPSIEDWAKVEKVCQLLELSNLDTQVISSSEYPTSDLYLPEVWRVKQEIDRAIDRDELFMKDMTSKMKLKFDRYWGDSNLLMAIASVLDPRCKLHVVNICFHLIYKPSNISKEQVDKVMTSLQMVYKEYAEVAKEESATNISGERDSEGNSSFSRDNNSSIVTGFDQIMSIVRIKEAVPPSKLELQAYLDEPVHNPKGNSRTFSALQWWKKRSSKYNILSRMVADILTIPISIVASESCFSLGRRVIDDYHSNLNEESIEELICGGDWLRNKYCLKKKKV